MKTQIMFTPDTRAIHNLCANWENIVFDIHEYLLSEGFEYHRTLGYIRDGNTDKKELEKIFSQILDIGLGPEFFVAIDSAILDDVTDLTYLFRESE